MHTFRLVDAKGQVHFRQIPLEAANSACNRVVWNEAVKMATAQDPDFHRRDMFDSIEKGNFFEWEFGVQLLAEADEMKFDFDILDATKIWPEDLIPVQRVGRLVLNRNPDNYFAETEQVAFMTSNVPPGVDFSHDPLLQGRNFSYNDTQLSRLGSPNFHEIPINRPICPFSNNQRDAHMRTTINKGRVSYAPASLDGHVMEEVGPKPGFVSYPQQVAGPKVRERSPSFDDHYGQASLFWNSMTPIEKEHITNALRFELSKVETRAVRVRMLDHLAKINTALAAHVAQAIGENLGLAPNKAKKKGTADAPAELPELASATTPTTASGGILKTKGLSMEENQPKLAKGRVVAILAGPGVAIDQIESMQAALKAESVLSEIIGPYIGDLAGEGGTTMATKTYANTSSVHFDAIYVPGGGSVEMLMKLPDALHFVDEAYKHGKAIGASAEGIDLVKASGTGKLFTDDDAGRQGIVLEDDAEVLAPVFISAVAEHRFHDRQVDKIMA